MAAKRIEVFKWLEENFKDLEIPAFERSESNVNRLYDLMLLHKEHLKDLEAVNSYTSERIPWDAECEKSAEKCLKDLGINENFLDPESQKKLDCLATLYHCLNIRNVSASNIMLALNELEEEDSKLEQCLGKEEEFAENLLELSKSVSNTMEQLNSVCEAVKERSEILQHEQSQEERRHRFNKEKMKKYQASIKSLEGKLSKVGFEEKVSLSFVSEKVKELSDLKKTVEEKHRDLEHYSALPPDLTLAEVKVEELKQILEQTMRDIIVHSYSGPKEL